MGGLTNARHTLQRIVDILSYSTRLRAGIAGAERGLDISVSSTYVFLTRRAQVEIESEWYNIRITYAVPRAE